ncbi:MAG: NAD(P)/FAD-dependent oxidoreductase [Clostridia bacterium]|nr:NAD(P)/FAD-dependent oxidoreductase [Clostridia bacterium]
MEVDVLIVGGGIAGLTSAAYLTKNNYNVLVCEKQPKLGGLISSYKINGFTFDNGIRAFENSGIMIPMLKDFNISIELLPNPVKIGIGNEFVEVNDRNFLKSYKNLLAKNFPKEKNNIETIVKKIELIMNHFDVLYEIDNPIFIENMNNLRYLFKTLFPWLVKYKKSIKKVKEFNIPVVNYLKQFTKNQSLIDIITQHFFEKIPAFFALSYFGFYCEYKYPVGGTSSIIDKISSYIENNGTTILRNTEVINVDLDRKEIITFNGKIIKYKKMIWAGNQKSLYENIKKLPNKKTFIKKQILSKSRGSDSVFTINLGVKINGDYFQKIIGPHAFFTPFTKGISFLGKWQDSKDINKWLQDYLKYTTYEISCPSLRDSSLAPKNQTNIIVSTLFNYDLALYYKNNKKIFELEKIVTDNIINLLNETIFLEIKKNIIFQKCSTPLTIEKYTGNTDGSLTGWAYTNKIMPSISNFKKISKSINTTLPNVYQAGQWTFSPAGMPTSILTGKLAADKIIKKGRIKK